MARRIKLSQLDYFRAVGQFQHVTKAAQHLGISQPALSRAIAALEADIGIPLFEHRRRSVRLTENGEVFLRYIERALAVVEDGFEALHDLNEPGRGKIKIGFVRTLGLGFIPQLIRLFREKYPNVQMALIQNNSVGLETNLKNGDLDLIFVTQISDQNACVSEKLASQEIQLVVPANHKYANRESVTLDELKDESFICFQEGHALRDTFNRIFQSAGFKPNISFECDDGSYLVGFVTAGLGLALMPPNSGEVIGAKTVKITSPDARRDVIIAWPKNRYVNQSTAAFIDFSKSAVAPDMTFTASAVDQPIFSGG
jgi:DNA-binding transcriptional LysR family regulator